MTGYGLRRLFEAMRAARIAVAGDFCLDAYWQLHDGPPEHSVETGLPTLRADRQRYSLGGAGNVVANLVALGVGEVKAIGVYGRDPFGAAMLDLLVELGANTAGMQDLGPDWQTLAYAKPYVGDSEQRRLDFGTRDGLAENDVRVLVEHLHEAAEWGEAVVINQQAAGCFAQPDVTAEINAIIAAHAETLFVVDARDTAALYVGAVLKVNAREAVTQGLVEVGGGSMSDEQATDLAEQITRRTGRPVFVTRGDRGIVAADAGGVYHALGIDVTSQVDPVGGGDTAVATVAAVLACGGGVPAAAHLANIAASVTVRKIRTTGTVTPAELVAAAERADYVYSPEVADNPARARYVPDTEIELIGDPPTAPTPTHVIFDFDGTLSTLRQGWEDVMEPMMIRSILGDRYASVDAETYQRGRSAVMHLIDRTTGIQTLVQMQGLVGLVRQFGLVPEDLILDAHGYKEIFNNELLTVVRRRLAKLAAGHLQPSDFHMKNALTLLELLREQGLALYLASGTDVEDVVAEAHALGFGQFFEHRIYGSVGDVNVEAKRVVLDRIFRENKLEGGSLVTFGDGPVEMRETRKAGGIPVGVCSDEQRRYGFNPAKRGRLIRGGATILVPDFSDLKPLLTLLGLS